ncbi:MAG: tetratricopeptide repeat protein, partial [Alphaproteobacteria bacterium]|nr:tetratricopeptide repeat protein [Alphaproteobacteria bacterium]
MIDLQLNAQPKPPAPASFIKDTDEAHFEQDALQTSLERPVIALFLSSSSAICKQMAATLEKLVAATAGAVALVRADVMQNPGLAQALRLQSVPTVYVFHQGRPVDGFTGAKGEAELKTMVEGLKKLAGAPEETDKTALAEQAKKIRAEADGFFGQNNFDAAMERYAAALEIDEGDMEALAGIGWCLLGQGDAASVKEMLAGLTPEQLKTPRLQGLHYLLSLEDKVRGLDDALALADRLIKNPKDLQARYDLAQRQLAAGQIEKGIDTLVDLIRLDREWQEQKARKLLLE